MSNFVFEKKTRIYIAGHSGMVGAATLNLFRDRGYDNLLVATSKELNLTNQCAVQDFFQRERPEVVIMCAAKVGGIQANIDNPATFLLDNLQIQNNTMASALATGVRKFVFLGSSCIYPRECPQPMREDYLMTGPLEPTNEGYAIAKIAGIKLLEGMRKQHGFNSISLMPCNLYGPNDSFDLKHSHVLSALVKRFADAQDAGMREITLWGTGIARREFMHVHDMARAIHFMLERYNESQFINIGTGTDVSIKELAEMIATEVGYTGNIGWDASKPNGMLKKCMDVSRMHDLGFAPEIGLQAGIREMVKIYREQKAQS